MHVRSALRVFAGLGVAGTLVATTAIPAAARAAVELSIFFADSTIAVDGPGKVEGVIMSASEPVVLHQPTVRFDATDLDGVAEIAEEVSSDCTEESPGILVCQDPFDVEVDEFGYSGIFDILVTAAQGATEGDEGTLRMTLTAPGLDPATTEARVRVGEGVDLAAGDAAEVSAAPGAAFTAPLRLRNAGETVAEGAVAVFFGDYGIEAGTRHSNCTYDGNYLNTCTFDQDLAAGSEYAASLASRLRPDTYAPSRDALETVWMTPAEFEDFLKFLGDNGASIGEPGDGPKLTLADAGAMRARGAQADVDPYNNSTYVEVNVTGTNGVDLEAVGATFDGAAGSTHETELGVVNRGPAVLDSSRSGEPITRVIVDVPPGTSAVEVSADCVPFAGENPDWEHPGKPGGRKYQCDPGLFLAPDEELVYPFTFRIDEVVEDAAGAVTANAACECPTFPNDTDKSNDVAKILVNGTGGGGGGLPVTGASTGLVAGAGALLLLAGAAGFVIARRRRTRFVA
ncbi:LPXTG cell wall anchor domain-containing protein [Phytohabitans sp. ZYX-F-186]|uniref:LPXTG cell wall anchor domain-containing protein n=1 Tax=Phytohabitans maris TaxID=3071409 RepID=A0ABU0ZRL1_9ACTN|nr:LPXTG cell wall anchor domain-containing protein [Phytohabitans sp. ZYX-F-186]MDQ7909673.1 LPXTG cell wall anchor domain-containing protein [Phytohabitans sp. ZYX-F-186]